jgi:hypothetical protein
MTTPRFQPLDLADVQIPSRSRSSPRASTSCRGLARQSRCGSARWWPRARGLLLFPGEDHGMTRSGRIDRRLERLRQIEAWLAAWLA